MLKDGTFHQDLGADYLLSLCFGSDSNQQNKRAGACAVILAIHHWEVSAVAQIGEPVRRYTVIPLEEPVSPTPEPLRPPPPSKSPQERPPIKQPEPVRECNGDLD
jgi:hypothetical protein